MTPRRRLAARRSALAPLLAFSALAACDGGAASTAPPFASTTSAAPSAPASAAVPARPLDALGRIPVDAAAAARAALAKVVAGRDPGSPDYRDFRRAVARGEPFFRERGFQAEALFGGGPVDETGGALGRLDLAMEARDAKAIDAHAAEVSRALLLLEDSLSRAPSRPSRLADVLPRAAYWLGAAIAGSKPGQSRAPGAALADALGLLDAIGEGTHAGHAGMTAPGADVDAAATRVHEQVEALREALEPAAERGALSDRARLVVATGLLGAALRDAMAPLGKPWRPYAPLVPGRGPAPDEPVTVLTVPALSRGAARDPAEEERLAALGERLFSDRTLSAGGARSCATCHVPAKAYTDGRPRPESLLPETPILRNTPTLLYASLHAAQFWDGRALTSERQAVLVMHSKAEMAIPDSAFPRPGVASEKEAAAALSAFQARRLIPADSPLDRFSRGEEAALSDEDRAGFDVFAGKGRCARCHVPPLFGGSHPPDFATAVYSALGVPETAAGKALDPDRGRAVVTRRELHAGAFKTPTARNAGRTAPYFHNGAFPTLESVIDFYDKGGGAGLGLQVPNQDPDVVPLRLTEAERRALLRFLRVGLADAPRSR